MFKNIHWWSEHSVNIFLTICLQFHLNKWDNWVCRVFYIARFPEIIWCLKYDRITCKDLTKLKCLQSELKVFKTPLICVICLIAWIETVSEVKIQLTAGSDRVNKWALWSYSEGQTEYEQFILIDVTKPQNEVNLLIKICLLIKLFIYLFIV